MTASTNLIKSLTRRWLEKLRS